MLDKESKIPKTLSSHITKIISTTMLNTLLIVLSIGINLLTNQRRKPAIMIVIRMLIKGMIL